MEFVQTLLLPPLRRCIGMLPVKPPAMVLCLLLNRHLLPQLDDDARSRITGRHYVIEVVDFGVVIGLMLDATGFKTCSPSPTPDIRIAADSLDFVRLAAREIDADTLFFNRRLIIQGETELALIVRNAIDSIDFGATRGGAMLHGLLQKVSRRITPSSL